MTQSPHAAPVELKACPFCSKDGAVLSTIRHQTKSGTDWKESLASVFCDDCGGQTSTYGNPKAAIEAWNTRTLAPDQTALIAKLRELIRTYKLEESAYARINEAIYAAIYRAKWEAHKYVLDYLIDSQAKTNGGVG